MKKAFLLFMCTTLWCLARPALAEGPEASSAAGKTALSLEERLAALEKKYDERMEALERKYLAEIKELRGQVEELSLRRVAGPPNRRAGIRDDFATTLDELFSANNGLKTRPENNAFQAQRGFQSMNPDISIVGDFVLSGNGRGGKRPDNAFGFRESELAITAYADPFTRADFFIAFERGEGGETVTDLEEGYLTFLDLPYDLQTKVGKMRIGFGKANAIHEHSLPWPDYPFVIQNFFGEEGFVGEGVNVSWLIPNRRDRYMVLSYTAFNNDNETLFAGGAANSFTHLLRFRDSNSVSENANLELGASLAAGPNTGSNALGETLLGGLDFTYKWRPAKEGLYKSFLWQSELIAATKDRGNTGTANSWGAYTALQYQFDRPWAVGTRFDFSQFPDQPGRHEAGYSAYLTFLQSEFVRWRVGYTFRDQNFSNSAGRGFDNEFFLQLTFGIGPHRAHDF